MDVRKAGYHGLYLPGPGIALDGYHPKADYLFVSHAHADHMPRNRAAHAYASAPTLEFMKLRGFRGSGTPLDWNERIETDRFTAQLYPAGHILGSAMIYIEWDGGTLLYTGDYRTPPSPATEGFSSPDSVDILITEATFSLPIYKWKSNEKLAGEIRSFADDSIKAGCTPVFLGYSLGKIQEIMHLLAPLGHPVMIHEAGFALCSVYEKYGIDLGNYSCFDPDNRTGNILLLPPSARSNEDLFRLPETRTAWCSGWASNKLKGESISADKMIPLSDHLDFFQLIEFCKNLSPKKVYITHTPNPDVVAYYLEKEGLKSFPLHPETDPED